METLTREELMFVRGCVLAEKRALEAQNQAYEEQKNMSTIDRVNYAYNKTSIEKFDKILEKLK